MSTIQNAVSDLNRARCTAVEQEAITLSRRSTKPSGHRIWSRGSNPGSRSLLRLAPTLVGPKPGPS